MQTGYKILQWDSDFFGFKIAKILPSNLKAVELENILESLKMQNVSLVYWATDPADEESQNAAKTHNGFLVDKKITYLLDLNTRSSLFSMSRNVSIEEYTEVVATAELETLAFQAGIFSRFNIDPKFSRKDFERLYKIWIQKSVTKTVADTVLVIKKNDKLVGMVTVGEKNSYGYIGLLAVDESMRGKNIGISLVYAAQKCAAKKGLKFAQVVTQEDNVAACRLYEKCGYLIEKTEYYYHFWM